MQATHPAGAGASLFGRTSTHVTTSLPRRALHDQRAEPRPVPARPGRRGGLRWALQRRQVQRHQRHYPPEGPGANLAYPGRTQLINFFALGDDESRRLVDLPGYGYAKVPEAVKREWQQHLADYLRARRSLRGVVLVMDVRHPLTEFDQTLLGWADDQDMPVHILLTKSDKLKSGAAKGALQQVRSRLREWEDLVSLQLFSSLKRQGIDETCARLDDWLLGAD